MFIRILTSLLFTASPIFALANWSNQSPPTSDSQVCSGELFEGSKTAPLVWRNGRASFEVCAFEAKVKKDIVELHSAFEIKANLQGKSIVIASEPEIGALPARVVISERQIQVLRMFPTLADPRHIAYSQTISCTPNNVCTLGKANCELKSTPKSKAATKKLSHSLRSAAALHAKRAIWTTHFFEGKNLSTGSLILIEAAIGNKEAERVAKETIGADAGLASAQLAIGDQIARIKEICGR